MESRVLRVVTLIAVLALLLGAAELTSRRSIAQPETQGPTETLNPDLNTVAPEPTATLVQGQQTPIPTSTTPPVPTSTTVPTTTPVPTSTSVPTLPPIRTPPNPGGPPTLIPIRTVPPIRTIPVIRTVPPVRTIPSIPIRTPIVIRTIPPLSTAVPPTSTPVPTATGVPGSLTIYSHLCDNQGFTPYRSHTLAEVMAECPVGTPEVTFKLTGSSSGFAATVTTSGGVVTVSVPPPGVGIQRAPVPGYDLSEISCSNDSFNKDSPKSIAHYAAASIGPGEAVVCHWFNVLASDDVNLVLVSNLLCDAGPGLTDPLTKPTEAQLAAATCAYAPKMEGTTYTLQVGSSGATTTAGAAVDSYGRSIGEFLDLPMDTYKVSVNVPGGVQHIYVDSCSGGFGGPSFTTMTATGSGFGYDFTPSAAGETYTCTLILVRK